MRSLPPDTNRYYDHGQLRHFLPFPIFRGLAPLSVASPRRDTPTNEDQRWMGSDPPNRHHDHDEENPNNNNRDRTAEPAIFWAKPIQAIRKPPCRPARAVPLLKFSRILIGWIFDEFFRSFTAQPFGNNRRLIGHRNHDGTTKGSN